MSNIRGKVILPGGSGFLGRTLAAYLRTSGYDVIVLARGASDPGEPGTVRWDGRTTGDWAGQLEGAVAVVNLAGRSVNCRYHERNRREMMDSRVESTRVLGEAIRGCSSPPRVWINSSTATIYKHTFGAPHDESGEIGATPEARDAFSIEVARAWEAEFDRADTPGTRKVAIRSAMVLGNEPGGVHEMLRRLTLLGLGGRMSHGRQFVSWMHAADFCRAVAWLIGNDGASGVYNLASPRPLPNREMMAAYRRVFGVPVGLPAARWMLEIGAVLLRTETELIIKSRRVVPARLLSEGFTFEHEGLEDAIRNLKRAEKRPPAVAGQ